MYENQQDSSPQTNVNCGVSSLNWSYYRVQPEDAKTTSQSSAPRSTTAATTSDAGSDNAPATPSLIPDTTPKKKSSSKAWIAGVVIGPIIGLALIGFLAWFCIRRKKRSNPTAAAATGAAPPSNTYNTYPQPAAPTGPASPPQYYPPPMQQNQAAGTVPFGVADAKHTPSSPTSPVPNPQSMYGTQPQWPQQGGHAGPGQPVYNAPSPSMSPQPQGAYAETSAHYQQPQAHEARPFSSELDGSSHVVPKQN
ncbi:hypothetical protein N0V95_002450 [Ascochyta clinopodiicola]|nr:hypothetical protein N0V95_002450 [Ascochyta clinopodiicola]